MNFFREHNSLWLIIVLAALVSLACDLSLFVKQIFARPVGEAYQELHPETSWTCFDSAGYLTRIQQEAASNPEQNLKRAELNIEVVYRGEEDGLVTYYDSVFERADLVIDGASGAVVDQNTVTLQREGIATGMALMANGTFSGRLAIRETREESYPEPSNLTVDLTHNLIGLVDPAGYQRAYLCDLGANPWTGDLNSLTAANFQEHCMFDYYECTLK